MTGHATPTTNIIVPLTIDVLAPGARYAEIAFGADLKRQYYTNANMEFRVPEPSSLRMVGLPIDTALKKIAGQWREIYDQDVRFEQIGEVTETPEWHVSSGDQRRLLTTTIPGRIKMQFYEFVHAVREKYLGSHDIVLEITGQSFVQSGYPKSDSGVVEYGTVDFEIAHFDAIYIVPKGGPSGTRFLS